MSTHEDFLVEIQTEELPPTALLKLANAFSQHIKLSLEKNNLAFENIQTFATPRRLAVLVKNLVSAQQDQTIERKGPALAAAFDAQGKPTPACVGFARSCQVSPEELTTIKNAQGEWVGYIQKQAGQSVTALLPGIVVEAANVLPIPKRMRWGDKPTQFVRPVHSVIMLYGDQIIPAHILGCEAGRVTRGHRFMAPDFITIPHASTYASLLETEGYVLADFAQRRARIIQLAETCIEKKLASQAKVLCDPALLDEVTGLVEWPTALIGSFDEAFLRVPPEVLISAMQDHQRYFPVVDANQALLPYFVVISNIESHAPERVIHGNQRVLRARLSDADFFYTTDQQESLAERLTRLKGIVFQAKLGTLYDKAERLSQLSEFIAQKIKVDTQLSARAGLLAKTDLTTQMVGEFPELQGVMGYYYALHDNEPKAVANAIKEHYMPRFAGDSLPTEAVAQVVALADRIDTLTGTFGINQIPTGDKDPYGLRRAALGVLRILIENQINLDLKEVLVFSIASYQHPLQNADVLAQVINFLHERLRAWYQEQGITADVFAAVAALNLTNPLDIHQRMKAVQAFKKLPAAETLSIANKRVSNILAKYDEKLDSQRIDSAYFESPTEEALALQLETKEKAIASLFKSGKYDEVLLELSELRKPVDDFFDHVMVMTEDKKRRENRILLLTKLRALFLQVADIALLQ